MRGAVTDRYEHRQMMEIRNKLVNWRRRRRGDRLTAGLGIIYTPSERTDGQSDGRTDRRRCHYCVSCPTATRRRRRVMFVYPSVRPSVRAGVSGTSLATASIVSAPPRGLVAMAITSRCHTHQ